MYFGATLLAPLRHRLRFGSVRFTVYVHQRQQDGPGDARAAALQQLEEMHSHVEVGDVASVAKNSIQTRSSSKTKSQASEEEEAPSNKAQDSRLMEEALLKIRSRLALQTRRGRMGDICAAVVVGTWRRVE